MIQLYSFEYYARSVGFYTFTSHVNVQKPVIYLSNIFSSLYILQYMYVYSTVYIHISIYIQGGWYPAVQEERE